MLSLLTLAGGCGNDRNSGDQPTAVQRDLDPPSDKLYLHVGPDVRADLALIDKEYYVESELEELFARLALAGDHYCRMFYDLAPRDESRMAEFIKPGWRYFTTAKHSKWNSRAGCWNFFRMNDRFPAQDFKLVRRLYPATAYDCYAIGLPQPYIMHSHLGCRTLTMVDFSWRIQDAHRRLLALYRANKVAEKGPAAFAEVPFTWVANGDHSRPPPARETGQRPRLCTTREECEGELLGFQDSWASIERIQLSLASLHEMEFLANDATTPRIIYLSNALDPGYSSEAEFWLFMTNLTRAMRVGETVVLIYHAGNRRDFALYEVAKNDSEYAISLRCHDIYREERRHPGVVSATWPDRFVNSHDRIPSCQDLLEETP